MTNLPYLFRGLNAESEKQETEPIIQPAKPDTTGLTKSQIEVAGYVARGMDNVEIARVMFIARTSVIFHTSSLMRFFGAPTRYKLICILYEKGWR